MWGALLMNLNLSPEAEALFAAALELSEPEQDLFLTRECREPKLRDEVRTLLRNYRAAGSFLEPRDEPRPECPIPAAIGRYRILRLIGEGGMGLVYEAEQQQPRRTVALKVIKGGLAGPETLRRFEQEAQVLGSLQHPGIAQIFDAGTADTGFGPQPYFAMEYIEGASILRFAEDHRLNARQRIELAAGVCAAVQHAHERGIIHRDLKPGNILVDKTGRPKILDFGIAWAAGREQRETAPGELVGTLEYMSPEQVSADPSAVDGRSDVYSLGVILFELLTGRLPYSISRDLHQAIETIREQTPARIGTIVKGCRGDIEIIAAKALEKDKARRYSSAAELAADFHRYLANEPIGARPPSKVYQLRKLARRHRVLVAATAVVLAVLTAGLIFTTREALRAGRAEQAANAINDFLQNDLIAQAGPDTQALPGAKPDPELKVRAALDRAAARIPGKFRNQPLVEASIRQTIGKAYKELGLYPAAKQHVQRALEIRERLLGEKAPETLRAMSDLALLYRYSGDYARAESLGSRALDLQKRYFGERNPDTLASMSNLVELLRSRGRYPQAEALGTKLLGLRHQALGENHTDTLESMNNLGLIYLYEGKYAQAEPLFTSALTTATRIHGNTHPAAMTERNNLAILYYRQGRYAKAEVLLDSVLQQERQTLGGDHPSTLLTSNNLAMTRLRLGQFAQAEQLNRETLESKRRTLGAEHPSTLNSENSLALTDLLEGKLAQARPLILGTLETKRRVLGEDHPETLNSTHTLAVLYLDERNYGAAEPLLVKLRERQARVLGAEHPDTLITIGSLARLYFETGDYTHAQTFAEQHVAGRRRSLGPDHPVTANAMILLGRILLVRENYPDAESLAREALAAFEKTKFQGWERSDAESLLGGALSGQGRFAEAEAALLPADQGVLRLNGTIPWESRPVLAQSAERLARLYLGWGKPAQHQHWQSEFRRRGKTNLAF
jgi:tetratricopeptide (TPR) repeat protein